MGLYRIGMTNNSDYNKIFKDIGYLYQPYINDAVKTNTGFASKEPVVLDVDFFTLLFPCPIVEPTVDVDEKKLAAEREIFFNTHFRL